MSEYDPTATEPPRNLDWCPRARAFVPIEREKGDPPVRVIIWGRMVRRVWAELTRAQGFGEALPTARQLAARCRLPSTYTAQECLYVLVSMGVVDVIGRHEESELTGRRQRITGALRVVKPYGCEVLL